MHLVEQPLVALNVDSRGLQAWGVNELDPDPSHSASDDPDALGGRLEGIGGGSLLLIQHTVDGGALAHASHANDHDSAGKGEGLVGLGGLLGLSCADGCLKAVGAAGAVAGLGDANALG